MLHLIIRALNDLDLENGALNEILVFSGIKTALYHRETEIFYFLNELLDRFTNHLLRLGARAHDATRAEDEKHGLRLLHAVNQAGKDLGFIHGILHDDGRLVEIDGHVQVATGNEVLNGDLRLGRDIDLRLLQVLDDDGDNGFCFAGVAQAGYHHLAGAEYQDRCLGVCDAHDQAGKALGIVFALNEFSGDLVQVDFLVGLEAKCHGRDDVFYSPVRLDLGLPGGSCIGTWSRGSFLCYGLYRAQYQLKRATTDLR